jgi:inner membrane protein
VGGENVSKSGHLLTATALAYAVYERSASPTLAVATLMGSSFPDIGEIVQFRGRWRASLIPHRTLTHWIPLYVAIVFALPILTPNLPWWLANLIKGICFGSLLHIALDMFSPAGIPLLHPFGTRRSLGLRRDTGKPCLYRTGTAEELPVIATAVVGIVVFLAPHPAPFSLQTFETQSLGVLVSFVKWFGITAINLARHMGASL